MPRYVVAQDEQSQSDSSDEEEQAQEQESDAEENGVVGGDDKQQTAEEAPAAAHDRKKIKLSLKQKQKDVCHVRCQLLQIMHAWPRHSGHLVDFSLKRSIARFACSVCDC